MVVLPACVAACAADFWDGRLARRRGLASMAGRLLDNLCDAAFLALALSGFALAHTWSLPLVGSATRYWRLANWLPVIGLAASFGTYLLRWAVAVFRGLEPVGSSRGHSAGIANYALTLLGGIAVLPNQDVTSWLLEPSFITVALLNLTAATDNLLLLAKLAFLPVRR
jgi:phosphatidylglycerophosphate synthase